MASKDRDPEKAAYPQIGDVMHDKYQVTRHIGAGSFSAIFEVQDVRDGRLYAIKLERTEVQPPQLRPEFKIYEMIQSAPAFPSVYEYWTETHWRGMVMDRLGYSLGYYYRISGKILSLKTVLHCAIQMVSRLEYLHQRSFVHQDIKPDNFVFGVGTNSNTLYLIDLGLARKYRNMATLEPSPYEEGKGLIGTTRYVSINVHLGVEQSCRDDLESVGYVLIALALGRLPWDDISPEKPEEIQEAKMNVQLDVLCAGLPNQFFAYMEKVRSLKFDERPIYAVLRGLFVHVMVKQNLAFDYRYDWVVDRERRIDASLKGATEPDKVQIPVNPGDIDRGAKGNLMAINCMQPLPLFTSIHQAASFMGRSKRTSEQTAEREVRRPNRITANQDAFTLKPREGAKLGPVSIDFDIAGDNPFAPKTTDSSPEVVE
jgi:serine/threonine protein kinase